MKPETKVARLTAKYPDLAPHAEALTAGDVLSNPLVAALLHALAKVASEHAPALIEALVKKLNELAGQ